MDQPLHLTWDELQAGLPAIERSPVDVGVVTLLVRRPKSNAREVVETVELSLREGVPGDRWSLDLSADACETDDSAAAFENQLTLMNSRAAALIAGPTDRWPLAGDQIYVDFSLCVDHIPPGTLLDVGEAVLRVSPVPHTGCGKFRTRFGADALRFVNSSEGRRLNLRGINARVIRPGAVRLGDTIRARK